MYEQLQEELNLLLDQEETNLTPSGKERLIQLLVLLDNHRKIDY